MPLLDLAGGAECVSARRRFCGLVAPRLGATQIVPAKAIDDIAWGIESGPDATDEGPLGVRGFLRAAAPVSIPSR